MKEEGVIKFNCKWQKKILEPTVATNNLIIYRQKLFAKKLIGFDEKYKVGYGNISIRDCDSNSFFITGTQTGNLPCLKIKDIALVKTTNINTNEVSAIGKVKASSESLTHSMFYQYSDSIQAVIHVHHKLTWEKWLNKAPTTNKTIPYGTPAMALEINRLFKEKKLMKEQFLVMAGHEDGIISFGDSIEAAYEALIERIKA